MACGALTRYDHCLSVRVQIMKKRFRMGRAPIKRRPRKALKPKGHRAPKAATRETPSRVWLGKGAYAAQP